jgi:hypothetical protein
MELILFVVATMAAVLYLFSGFLISEADPFIKQKKCAIAFWPCVIVTRLIER